MTEPTPITLSNVADRLAALEFIMENILPMLIQDARYQQDVQRTLEEWHQEPPPQFQGNEAFPLCVEQLLDGLPD